MSFTGAQVYLNRDHTVAVLTRWLAEKLPAAEVTRARSGLGLRFMGAELALPIDRSPHVRVEARELAERAPPGAVAGLRRATRRLQIVPADPRADEDTLYNPLLIAFEILRALPGAVGLDPYDGSFYFADPAPPQATGARRR